MKKFTLLFVIVILSINTFAQAPSWQWAQSAGNFDTEWSNSVFKDASGNVFMAGMFTSPTITFGTTVLSNAGGRDAFIVEYDATGNVLWAQSAGGTADEEGYSISTDANGNVFMSGYFSSASITFGTITLTNTPGSTQLFITKYDAAGTVLWAKTSVGYSLGKSVSTDAGGSVFLTGLFASDSIIFGTTTLYNAGAIANQGSDDIFIVKYDGAGNVQWAKSAGGKEYDFSNSVAADANGNVFICGSFNSDTIIFETTSLINSDLSPTNTDDIFIAKYNASGILQWVHSSGGNNSDAARSVCLDASGNAFITGYFASPAVTFGTFTLPNSYTGSTDVFITKYNAAGTALWAHAASGTSSEYSWGVSTDLSGNAYITGSFYGPTLTFGTTTLTNAGSENIFVTKYDGAGTMQWALSTGGNIWSEAYCISANGNDNLYIAGSFASSQIDFGAITITNAGSQNIFIAKICQMNPPVITANGPTTFCQGDSVILTSSAENFYLWSNGEMNQSITVFNPEIDSVMVTNINGCSISSLPVTINVNPLPIVSLALTGGGMLFLCNNVNPYSIFSGGSPAGGVYSGTGVSNDTIYCFGIPDGTYAITYTYSDNNSCINTAIDSVHIAVCEGVNEEIINEFSIFPNPFNSQTTITGIMYQVLSIEIKDVLGKTVKTEKAIGKSITLDMSGYEKGIYFVQITDENKNVVNRKVIVQ